MAGASGRLNLDSFPMRCLRPAWGSSLLIALGMLLGGTAHAQEQSQDQPIRIITQYAPGGGSDLLGRILVQELTGVLGRSVVLEPKPGGSGVVASNHVAASKPDGTTLLFVGSGATTVNPHLMKRATPIHPLANFRPVAMIAKADLLLVTPTSLPANSVPELVSLAKSKPGAFNYASSGNGTAPHVAGALFAKSAGLEVTHVPYKGSGPTYVDLVAGRTQFMFTGLGISAPYLERKQLKILATGGSARSELLPDVPTISESGLPGYEATVWYGVLAPKDVPDETVARLNQAIRTVMAMPAVKKRLAADNYSLSESQMSPQQFGDKISAEFEMWRKTLPQIGVSAD